MRKVLYALLVLSAMIVLPAGAADNVLDNKAVIEMVRLGLSQQVIIAKIHSTPTEFDTSPQALANLKHAGVPTGIVTEMVEAGTAGANTSPGATDAGSAMFQLAGADGAHVAISPVRVTAEFSARKAWIPYYHGGPETFLFIDGRHAAVHATTAPEFITNLNPLNVRLVHLGEKKDRDARYVVFSGSTTDREVQVNSSQLGNGTWSLKPAQPLQPGEEYAFLVWQNMPVGCGFWTCFAEYAGTSSAYDFAVQ